jgi:hypothetical protein
LVLAYVDCDACSKLQDAISTLLFGKTFMQRGCVLLTEQAADLISIIIMNGEVITWFTFQFSLFFFFLSCLFWCVLQVSYH